MIDLKDLLDDRSTTPPGLPQHHRLDQVQGRIATRRRRRLTTAGALAALVAVVVVGYSAMPSLRGAPDPAVTPSPQRVEAFADHLKGARVVATGTSAPGATSLSVVWTPTTLDVRIFYRCDSGVDSGTLDVAVTLDGRSSVGGSCGSGLSSFTLSAEAWTERDVRIGKPVVVAIAARKVRTWDVPTQTEASHPVPATATMALAIGENVPYAGYPMPPRPAELKPVDLDFDYLPWNMNLVPAAEQLWLRSDPADPARPMSTTIVWRDGFFLRLKSQTPGILGISLNGAEVDTSTFWDYEGFDDQITWDTDRFEAGPATPGFVPPKRGELVTLTVTPRDVTGAWVVRIAPGKITSR
jgi:hypothetical protein